MSTKIGKVTDFADGSATKVNVNGVDVAVVRIGGPRAGAALEALIGRIPEPRRAALARVKNPITKEVLDEALALWFPGPNSETGEDTVELQVHGGRAILSAVFAALTRMPGFRMAEPGEFTRRAFVRLPQRIQLQTDVGQAQVVPQALTHQDDFGVDVRARKAKRFRTKLVKLAIAPTLWTLVAKHGAHVIETFRAFVQHIVFHHCTHYASSCLGSQGVVLAIQAVFKGVHLLFDDVGDFAQATDEQSRGLHDRRA